MKRIIVVAVVVLLLLPALSFTVFAAAPPDDGGGFLGGLQSFGTAILEGLGRLFIPRDDYFPRLQDRLFEAFQLKFGGLLSVVTYLEDRLSGLRAYRGELFVMEFPADHLFGGTNVDLMDGAEGIAELIRGGLSGFVVLCTVVFAYKKVVAMINT